MKDQIIEIECIEEEMETIDINLDGDRLFYCNGILTHNSAIDESEQNQAMIGGGLSKIQKADNVISLFASATMKERGEFQCTFLKTRSSSGVDSKVVVGFDTKRLRIHDIDRDVDEDEQEEKRKPKSSGRDVVKKLKTQTEEKVDPETGEVIKIQPPVQEEFDESPIERLKRLRNAGKV